MQGAEWIKGVVFLVLVMIDAAQFSLYCLSSTIRSCNHPKGTAFGNTEAWYIVARNICAAFLLRIEKGDTV